MYNDFKSSRNVSPVEHIFKINRVRNFIIIKLKIKYKKYTQ